MDVVRFIVGYVVTTAIGVAMGNCLAHWWLLTIYSDIKGGDKNRKK